MERDLGHIVVTGASAGIGEAIARAFAGPGQKLTLIARRAPPMEALAADLRAAGAICRVVPWDLSDLSQAGGWIGDAEAELGPIDVLVLNAGVQIVRSALSVSDEEAEAEMRLNLLVPQRITRKVAPAMVARRRGTIVINASMAGITHTPRMADYSASKAGAAAYFETLRVELAGTGVNVVTVYPGPVATEMEKAARERLEGGFLANNLPIGTPDELGRLIRTIVKRGAARLVYPRIYGVSRVLRGTSQWVTNKLAPKAKD